MATKKPAAKKKAAKKPAAKKKGAAKKPAAKKAPAKKNRKELTRVNQLIDSGDILTAVDELMTLRFQDSEICPNAERIRKLATGLLKAHAFDEAEIWLQEFIDRFPEENG